MTYVFFIFVPFNAVVNAGVPLSNCNNVPLFVSNRHALGIWYLMWTELFPLVFCWCFSSSSSCFFTSSHCCRYRHRRHRCRQNAQRVDTRHYKSGCNIFNNNDFGVLKQSHFYEASSSGKGSHGNWLNSGWLWWKMLTFLTLINVESFVEKTFTYVHISCYFVVSFFFSFVQRNDSTLSSVDLRLLSVLPFVRMCLCSSINST